MLKNGLLDMVIESDGRIRCQMRDGTWRQAVCMNWTKNGLYWTVNGVNVGIFNLSKRLKAEKESLANDLALAASTTTHAGHALEAYVLWQRFVRMFTGEPLLIVTESTFESYNTPLARVAAMDAVPALGGCIMTFPTRNTASTRAAMGICLENSKSKAAQKKKDAIDATVLHQQLATGTLHLKEPHPPEFKTGARAEYELHRRNGTLETSRIAKRMLKWLPEPETMPQTYQDWWCYTPPPKPKKPSKRKPKPDTTVKAVGKKRYVLETMLPFMIAASEAGTRGEFEKEVGMYASAKPSYYRAVFYIKAWGSRQSRLSAKKNGKPMPGPIASGLLTQSDCRRETRRMFHLVKAALKK